MFRYVMLLAGVSAAAIGWAEFVTGNPERMDEIAGVAREERPEAPANDTGTQPVTLAGVERLRADRRGHHIAEFHLNAVRAKGMIDTGATAVAINRSTARRAGIALTRADFIYRVDTANGTVSAALTVLDEVRLGSIRVRDVEALVLEDDALNTVLIGMSFMNRLRGFSVENGTLVLRQ
ncbi:MULTISPECIES: TIGR02281 family clan AA aspartic protease [unclassified Roseitalea]|uniref:retropepsin-like aspartic protease family protein n=1 Tax=unclassified Roseitalea TaxID=2639107 RepID=UPI00273E8323|nr:MULTISPECIES: TIGR02281 family clan AA aspartic protease [unclassified Roseitalea]